MVKHIFTLLLCSLLLFGCGSDSDNRTPLAGDSYGESAGQGINGWGGGTNGTSVWGVSNNGAGGWAWNDSGSSASGGTGTPGPSGGSDNPGPTPIGKFPIGRWEGPHGASFTVTSFQRAAVGRDYYAGSITFPAFGTVAVSGREMETHQIIIGGQFAVNANVLNSSGATFFVFTSPETDTSQTFSSIRGRLIVTSTSGPSYDEDVIFVRK